MPRMRSVGAALALLLAVASRGPAVAAGGEAPPALACAAHGTHVPGLLACTLFAAELGRGKRLYVLLPPSYDGAPGRRYPVL